MNVAFIPVRGGSKSIPLKNIKEINGKPLVCWVVEAAAKCPAIDAVYVATDSEQIKKVVENCRYNKVTVVDRGKETATDMASTESAMLEFAQNREFDNIVLIQATSPLLSSLDLDAGMDMYVQGSYDSVLSVVRQKRFVWKTDETGQAVPVNYDVYHRPRRQEFEGYLVENGAFYVTSREALLRTGNRVSGRIGVVEMCEESYFEIDEPSDWKIVESLMQAKNAGGRTPSRIEMVLTDCDGCLTDGGMYYGDDGTESKKFNTQDGMGFQLLREEGIITGIITGEDIEIVPRRANKLKLDIVKTGITNKRAVVAALCDEYGVQPENVAYIGDDINDLEAMRFVGYGCSVNNGIEKVKAVAKYVSKKNGGEGAVREIIDYILCMNQEYKMRRN